eukprot:Cvel_28875.t1-p1 / transcript=Cvel_28875.t1 / gene=Cvel_28875 / organism=Chromera_velia_CCMP2878 / gene_product=Isoleucine--tRNA ligase, cytoplasmic, putative / transcript_product=Isoleucine--tRNA ligase, cytoplasmic, putative / location=Cvel_scaffold3859:1-10575(-) / protein_length=950 / sequence_SO=supercontig / SO=protein_coding / is_pseudo=false
MTSSSPPSSAFLPVPESPNFPKEEEEVLRFWREIDAFQKSYKQSVDEKRPSYNFYDGPPFATGKPHYGHILAGTIKDVITRYAHQTGHCVERRFGWDCHGLPVEHEIDKKCNIQSREDVLKMGIDKYNEECRSIVMRCAQDWRFTVERMGRWIDFDKDYKTLDRSFMESVWWVFNQLYEKKLVYRAFKVMPYSTGCSTALSNFEANLNYKEDVPDPSVIVTFPTVEDPSVEFLAWTTTPWTLPSNLALCVNPEFEYLYIKTKKTADRTFVVAACRLPWLCSKENLKVDEKKDVQILKKAKGAELAGTKYVPIFDYFKDRESFSTTAFRVITDGYVKDDSGTGIVHQAPAFGEEDYNACMKHQVIQKGGMLPCPIDDAGRFTDDVPDKGINGVYVKTADKEIKAVLKKRGRMLCDGTFTHRYPFCWRSDTPLIYRAVPCWFVNVESLKERLLANNQKTRWVPSYVKEKRFHNWLEEARDWCVSRNRFWGTPIPLWVSDDFEEIKCVGSVGELEKYAGKALPDVHRHFIDGITIPSSRPGKPPLKRVDEVFDCWFESGSMPYSQQHYPFENKEKFENGFPAQFIAEGLDQTRGWFYTLMVLSTALFDKPPFENVIVNGLVLAEDGKKMSKRLKNYPDPLSVVDAHGADAIRLYLCNSPVVRADPLRFKKDGVRDVVKDVFLPWYNAYRFMLQEVQRYESKTGKVFVGDFEKHMKGSSNEMDRWISASTHSLCQFVHEEMENYRLYTVVPRLLSFLEDLTNWYVRLNRDRMRGSTSQEDAHVSLCVLYGVLLTITRLMAPFTPFITEFLYQNLKRALPEGHEAKAESVHFVMVPQADPSMIDEEVEARVKSMQAVIEAGRNCRERRQVGLKTPLMKMKVVHSDPKFVSRVQSLIAYVKSELNVENVETSTDASSMKVSVLPNLPVLGKRVGKKMAELRKAIQALTPAELAQFD